MFVTEERNLIYKIESARRLAQVEHDYPVQQALIALPKRPLLNTLICWLNEGLNSLRKRG